MKKFSLVLLIIFFSYSTASAIERRSEQFPSEFGYLALPLPYIIPGAGTGFGILGGFNNIPFGSYESTLDVFAIGIAGAIGGSIILATDFPVYPEAILLDIGQGNFDKGSFRSYSNRRMDSDPDDYVISELSDRSTPKIFLLYLDKKLDNCPVPQPTSKIFDPNKICSSKSLANIDFLALSINNEKSSKSS